MTDILRIVFMLLLFFHFGGCRQKEVTNVNTNLVINQKPIINDARQFIIGKWEGRMWHDGEENVLVTTLTFQSNGKMIEVDTVPNSTNHQNGIEREFEYEFLADDVIKVRLYPDNLKILKINSNEIRFGKQPLKLNEEMVDIIYSCQFTRVN